MIKVNKDLGVPVVSFTPAFYKRALKNYKNGDYRDVLAMIEVAEMDGYISGCLLARNAGYKRKYEVSPASDSPLDVEVADFVKEVFKNLYIREFFEDMVDARMKGYTVIDFTWDIVDGKQLPVDYEKIEQKYFRRDIKDGILKIDWGKRLEDIPDTAFVIESSRKPIMLNVLQDYILKEFGRENWSSFIEIFGEPGIIGYYPPGNKEIKAELESDLATMGSSSRIIAPEGTRVDKLETQRTTGDHNLFVRDAKENISIALLGHKDAAGSDKQMQIGDNQTGIKVKHDIAVDDAFWIEDNIRPFLRMLISRNFNVKVHPALSIDKTQSVDPSTKLEAARIGLNAGAKIDPKFLTEFGIPLADDDTPDPLQQQPLFTSLGG